MHKFVNIATMPKSIPSSYDRTSIWIIQVFGATLVLIALLVQANYAFIISIGLIFLLAITASLALVPYQIQKDETRLILKRIAGQIEIKLQDIEKIEIIDYADLRRKIWYRWSFGLLWQLRACRFWQSQINGKK